MLIIGGTGNIGKAIVQDVIDAGFEVIVTGLEINSSFPSSVHFSHASTLSTLAQQKWDVIFDVYTFDSNHAQEVYTLFQKNCGHFFIVSTTLVYDRTGYTTERIKTDFPLAKIGTQGGYVDHKLQVEDFWKERKDVPWTILRPYHILGKGYDLGCLAPHNRDSTLIEKIKEGSISLCEGGRIALNVVHPEDLGRIVILAAGRGSTFGKSYNTVNPKEIIARDYYLMIASQLGVTLEIKSVSGEEMWARKEWVLTTLPHLYDISDLERDIGYVPDTPLEQCISDALAFLPPKMVEKTPIYQRMHLLPEPLLHKYFS